MMMREPYAAIENSKMFSSYNQILLYKLGCGLPGLSNKKYDFWSKA